jgi:hypothetical protein
MREASCHLSYAYTLSSTFAFIGGLLMFLVLRRVMALRWPWTLMAVFAGTLSGYWLFGYGVWAFLLLSAFVAWKVAVPVAIALACLMPLVRSHYNLTTTGLYKYPGLESLHAPDFNRETDLHMIHSYEVGDWDDVIKTATSDKVLDAFRVNGHPQVRLSQDAQVSSTVRRFMYNLVQAQRGNLPDVLLEFYPNYLGTFTSMIGTNIPMLMFMNLH